MQIVKHKHLSLILLSFQVILILLSPAAYASTVTEANSVITMTEKYPFDYTGNTNPQTITDSHNAIFSSINRYFSFVLTSTSIALIDNLGYGFGNWGWVTFTGYDNPITGLSLISDTLLNTGTASNVSFTSNSITFDLSGTWSGLEGQSIVYGINEVRASKVPEPALIFLLGLGFVLMAAGRRKTV